MQETICRQATPFFMQKDYGDGIKLLTLLTAQRFANEFHFALDTSLHAARPPLSSPSPAAAAASRRSSSSSRLSSS